MKLDNIEWLFFDVGSTLVSEEKPFLHEDCSCEARDVEILGCSWRRGTGRF